MHRVVASWFGTGLLLRRLRGADAGSGTVGAFFALILALLLGLVGWQAQVVGWIVVTVLSLWSAAPFSVSDDGEAGDPGWVVVDEAAGALLATLGLGPGPAIVAWLVFRFADIFKKAFPGVAAAERIPGSIGITADDLVAGVYGLAAGWLVSLLPWSPQL